MSGKQRTVGLLLLGGMIAVLAWPLPSVARDLGPRRPAPVSSVSPRGPNAATVIDRPGHSCARIQRSVTIQFAAVPANISALPVVAPLFTCVRSPGGLNVTLNILQPLSSPAEPGGATPVSNSPADQHYVVEVIYNFE